jgi:hypothetical protein
MSDSDPPPYAELYCRSNYSFLVGASEPEELIERAAAKLYTAIALTDECSVSGVVRAHLTARECGIHFIVGSEILLTTAGGHPHARIVFLAQDRRGYGNLCEAITLARRRAEKGHYLALVADYEGKTAKAPHLAGLPGCIALLLPGADETVEALFAKAMWLYKDFLILTNINTTRSGPLHPGTRLPFKPGRCQEQSDQQRNVFEQERDVDSVSTNGDHPALLADTLMKDARPGLHSRREDPKFYPRPSKPHSSIPGRRSNLSNPSTIASHTLLVRCRRGTGLVLITSADGNLGLSGGCLECVAQSERRPTHPRIF